MFFILAVFVYVVLNFRKSNKVLLILSINCFVGSILYILLFYQVFDVHDYYLINLLIIIPLILVSFFHLIKRNAPNSLSNINIKLLGIAIVSFFIYDAMVNTRLKYDSKDFFVKNSFIIDENTQNYWNWYHWNYSNTFKSLESIEPYLRKFGIQRTDKVISTPDQSINISLYLMNQKGFTDFGFNDLKGKNRIDRLIELGAKYLIVNDSTIYMNEFIKPYLSNKIGAYNNVDIYKLTSK